VVSISYTIKQKQDKAAMLTRSLELQVKMYPEKTHFIYELLQNAEDAESSIVCFNQYADRLEIFHDGKPFTESNVQSLCDAAHSDKSGKIGKFGIGFKSVFTICKTVELYSEPNNRSIQKSLPHFAIKIENYTDPIDIEENWFLAKPYTTRFVFRYIWGEYYKSEEDLKKDVAIKIRELGTSVLLFLRNIKEIQYNISGVNKELDSTGLFMLEKKELGKGYYKVTAVGNKNELDDTYLLFSRPLENVDWSVDIAFAITEKENRINFKRINSNYVSVYFPTQMESKLNFIIQAPFDIIPTRNSLEENSDNNTNFIISLSELLKEAIVEIRNNKWLSLDFLNILPFSIPDMNFPFKSLYKYLNDTAVELFKNENILPTAFEGEYVNRTMAKLARGGVREGGIVEMFSNSDLELLTGEKARWMPTKTDDANFTDGDEVLGKLYNFLKKEVEVEEIDNEEIPRLLRNNPEFIKNYMNKEDWLEKFYNYLVSKKRGDLGKCQEYSLIPFIKTTKNDFVSAYKLIDKVQFPNLYKKPENALDLFDNHINSVIPS
jgi:hypothetical protein